MCHDEKSLESTELNSSKLISMHYYVGNILSWKTLQQFGRVLVQGYVCGLRVASRAGFGLKFVENFRACIQNFCTTFTVTICFFHDVHSLRSPWLFL